MQMRSPVGRVCRAELGFLGQRNVEILLGTPNESSYSPTELDASTLETCGGNYDGTLQLKVILFNNFTKSF